MARPILKLGDYYLEYSTVSDAPISIGMNREEFTQYLFHKYGASEIDYNKERMDKADKNGSSSYNLGVSLTVNRAGEDETCLTGFQIYLYYCVGSGRTSKPTGIPLWNLGDDIDLIDQSLSEDGKSLRFIPDLIKDANLIAQNNGKCSFWLSLITKEVHILSLDAYHEGKDWIKLAPMHLEQ